MLVCDDIATRQMRPPTSTRAGGMAAPKFEPRMVMMSPPTRAQLTKAVEGDGELQPTNPVMLGAEYEIAFINGGLEISPGNVIA